MFKWSKKNVRGICAPRYKHQGYKCTFSLCLKKSKKLQGPFGKFSSHLPFFFLFLSAFSSKPLLLFTAYSLPCVFTKLITTIISSSCRRQLVAWPLLLLFRPTTSTSSAAISVQQRETEEDGSSPDAMDFGVL